MAAEVVKITSESRRRTADLARKYTSQTARQRALVSGSAIDALTLYFQKLDFSVLPGRCADPAFAELLDIADLQIAGKHVELRLFPRGVEPRLIVPTMPMMVGVFSEIYLAVEVNQFLSELRLYGWASLEDLSQSESVSSGLFIVVSGEELRPMSTLSSFLKSPDSIALQVINSSADWFERAERIKDKISYLLSGEEFFAREEVARLAAGVRDDILAMYGSAIPDSEFGQFLKQLFRRFGLVDPIPSRPGSQVVFSNRIEQTTGVQGETISTRYFANQLSVSQRVSFYRKLLADQTQLEHHLSIRRTVDRATQGLSFASPKRKASYHTARTQTARNSLPPAVPGQLRKESMSPVAEPEDDWMTISLEFQADPEIVRLVVEGQRLAFGHQFNPAFAIETSLIAPLPHQRIAVYERMLNQPRLRFLLADDAGAGKTIMTGLYIREMLSRRLIRRVLVVSPAGLIGNWEREMRTLFSLQFKIVTGADVRNGNPFIGNDSHLVVVSIDTLAGDKMFAALQSPEVQPYDVVVFDEAHKLSADLDSNGVSLRRTDRYILGEAIAGLDTDDERWKLSWSARHLLLLTATPHMGKDYPFYCLWRLLEPEALSTKSAFDKWPISSRMKYFIRRTKEEMVDFDGNSIYPERKTDTIAITLTPSEDELYQETTAYMQLVYNRGKDLNKSAVRLAMNVFQRRLASSSYALLRSLERRLTRLDALLLDLSVGRKPVFKKTSLVPDLFGIKTADEETSVNGREESEVTEDLIIDSLPALTRDEVEVEHQHVKHLIQLARRIQEEGDESKFERLRQLCEQPEYRTEKIIIFTEHRDTMDYLKRRLEGLGYTGLVATIHGGMEFSEREENVEHFRLREIDGGARFLVATDAAGEGINLQFCWIMINYDVPWNPARLEQRMGRIHRYGQQHDPVIIINLIAPKTPEDRVVEVLLRKLEAIRKELRSDKVYDVVGRLLDNISLVDYLGTLNDGDAEKAITQIEGKLTKEQVLALAERERLLYGEGGEVRAALPGLREQLGREEYRHLMPGYVRRFLEKASSYVGLTFEGDLDGFFQVRPNRPGALDPFLTTLEAYPPERRDRLTVNRPKNPGSAIFLYPGEPFFERLRTSICDQFSDSALSGAVFIDPLATEVSSLHVLTVSVQREADATFKEFDRPAVVECRLIAVRRFASGQIEECPVEQLLVFTGGKGIPAAYLKFAAVVEKSLSTVQAFVQNQVANALVKTRQDVLHSTLTDRLEFVKKGFVFQEVDLAEKRNRLKQKAEAGDPQAKGEITKIKNRQRELNRLRDLALASIRREPELLVPGTIHFIAHALVIPSSSPADLRQHQVAVEELAMDIARAFEETSGASVLDVSTPPKAISAGLVAHPGFDLLSNLPAGERRHIEVKGRAGTESVELTENEWVQACNLRESYWLYVVCDCATPNPKLLRVSDPFRKLVMKQKNSMVISLRDIQAANE